VAAPAPPWHPAPGCALVLLCVAEQRIGGIEVADVHGVTGHFQTDVAVVKAVGEGVDIPVDSAVIYRHYHGKRFRGLVHAGTAYPGIWALTGRAHDEYRNYYRIPFDKTMPAIIDDYETLDLRATGKQVIIDRGALVTETAGGIQLPDNLKHRHGTGRIVSMGSEVTSVFPDLEVGDEIAYITATALPITWVDRSAEKRDRAFVHVESILAITGKVGDTNG